LTEPSPFSNKPTPVFEPQVAGKLLFVRSPVSLPGLQVFARVERDLHPALFGDFHVGPPSPTKTFFAGILAIETFGFFGLIAGQYCSSAGFAFGSFLGFLSLWRLTGDRTDFSPGCDTLHERLDF